MLFLVWNIVHWVHAIDYELLNTIYCGAIKERSIHKQNTTQLFLEILVREALGTYK